ncbi:Bug family tripartite tricarboxylate transporter substrate binding protein [Reyranella sp.]|uniref:Bug family tripartite tricarboxylate transporter substrate binding protein n=1 Tax=Reyranella sp. TaxID=1929291 RepID=UPI003D120B5E
MTALTRRITLAAGTAFCCLAPALRRSVAQVWPDRPIRLFVGGAPGSVPDTLARVIAERLAMALNQPVIVENKPGAAGSLAIGAMLAAKPDGHTLALATMSQAVFNSYLFPKLAYDPLQDFAPVSLLATGAMAVAAHPAFPPTTFRAFVDLAKAQPGRIMLGTTAVGSPPHVFCHLMLRAAGIKVTIVPHTSGAEGMRSVMRGDVQLFLDAPTIISPQVAAGAVKVLVVTGRSREKVLPDVPTIAEAGLPDATAEAWIGLVANAQTPPHLVERLNASLTELLALDSVRRRLEGLSFVATGSTPQEFAQSLRDDHGRWGPIITASGIKLE